MSINLLSSYQYFSVAHPLEEANTFYMARLLQIDVKYVAKFAFVRGNLSKRVFCRKTHRFLPLYVLGNRSKTLLLPIICKSTDLPTASRLRSEGTSLKSHRLNSNLPFPNVQNGSAARFKKVSSSDTDTVCKSKKGFA